MEQLTLFKEKDMGSRSLITAEPGTEVGSSVRCFWIDEGIELVANIELVRNLPRQIESIEYLDPFIIARVNL